MRSSTSKNVIHLPVAAFYAYVARPAHVAYLLGEHLYAASGVGGGQTAEYLQLRFLPRTVAHTDEFPVAVCLPHDIAHYVCHIALALITGHDD